jgi:hypothetical protein
MQIQEAFLWHIANFRQNLWQRDSENRKKSALAGTTDIIYQKHRLLYDINLPNNPWEKITIMYILWESPDEPIEDLHPS